MLQLTFNPRPREARRILGSCAYPRLYDSLEFSETPRCLDEPLVKSAFETMNERSDTNYLTASVYYSTTCFLFKTGKETEGERKNCKN